MRAEFLVHLQHELKVEGTRKASTDLKDTGNVRIATLKTISVGEPLKRILKSCLQGIRGQPKTEMMGTGHQELVQDRGAA